MNRCLLIVATGIVLAVAPARTACAAQQPADKPELIYSEQPATWFEDASKRASLSHDGKSALYGSGRGVKLIDLATGRADSKRLTAGLDEVSAAVFYKGDQLAIQGRRGKETGWFVPGKVERGLELSPLPQGTVPSWSADGVRLAWYRASEPDKGLFIDSSGEQKKYENLGGNITGLVWSTDGSEIYVLVCATDGTSSLLHIHRDTGDVETVASNLDAAPYPNSLGLAPDGKHIFVALAGTTSPRSEDRHAPELDRSLNIYEVDLRTGARRLKIDSPTDVFAPTVANGYLYWTRNDIRTSIVVIPTAGGAARQVVEQGQLPRWERPGGNRIAFTYGAWRLADWALNLDAGIVDVDANAIPTTPMRPFVSGFHEDFTPAWSPDGKWIAFHSHRSHRPVSSYSSDGSADDVFLRSASGAPAEELRLTSFGWETGPADWSPDGRKLVFCSWEKGGTPGISYPWIVTIDPQSGKPLRTERLPLPPPLKSADEAVWSPDSADLAIEENTGQIARTLWIVSLDSKNGRKLVDYQSSTYGGLAWTPDGKTIVYGGLAGNRMQIFAIPRSGGNPQKLTDDSANLLHPWVSPDGRWIACTRISQSKELWRQKLVPGPNEN